ncbi:MAG: BrnA antitoxin family protein [Acidovorax sp.]|uniref:BrnA antitoxin family protein n=1 Tax=Acidovorax sp. TaxID=1872122 RepID=UPI0039E4794F
MSKTVRYEVNLNALPPLTAAQQAEIEALAKMSAGDIDYSDIPPLNAEFWQKAVRNPFYKPTKTATTVRVDSDVLAWLKSQGKGYQTRINAILREAMLRSVDAQKKAHG